MSEPLIVRPTVSWRDRRRFQRLPWSIYQGNPHWVPPIISQERELLGWGHHPFFDHAQSVTLLAERGGEVVGRVMVLINDIHNNAYNEKRGFFGFFECIDDVQVATAIFDAGRDWLRQRGMTTLRGPANPSLNYTCGLLLHPFDQHPRFLMTYNPPYYPALLEACGFAKVQDLYAYEMDPALLAKITARYKPAVLASLERTKLVIRPFNPKKYNEEMAAYLDIYNQSLKDTWGFTPIQPREAKAIGRDLKHLIVPQFALFAEIDGKPIGAMFALMDYNQIFRKLNGRLFPFGFIRVLTGKRSITAARALAMTMIPGYQNAGLGIVMLDALVVAAKDWHIDCYEFSWVLESNSRSRGGLEKAGTKLARTYRLYDCPL